MRREAREISDAIRRMGLYAAFWPGSIGNPNSYVFWIRRDDEGLFWLYAMYTATRGHKSTELRQPPQPCGRAGVNFVMNAEQWRLTQQAARNVPMDWRP